MYGGTASTPPVRSPAARPLSFHSLPEHQRNAPPYLPPHPHRRPRRPRSSPLTGPSLSSDQVDEESKHDEANQKPRYRPNRISSTPEVVIPIQSIYDSDATSLSSPSSSPPSTVSNGTNGIIVSHISFPKSSSSSSSGEDEKEKELTGDKEDLEDGNKLRSFVKRLSMISLSSLTTNEKDKDDDQKASMKRSSFVLHSSSTSSLASTSSSYTVQMDAASQAIPPIPTIPRWALNAMREEAGIASRNMKYGHQRGTADDLTPPPLPNQPIPRGVPLSTSDSSNRPRPSSISCDPTEDWKPVTDPAPRFSRLGLGGGDVVLPVKKSEGSIKSTKSTTTLSRSAGAIRDSWMTTKAEYNPRVDPNADPSADDDFEWNPQERGGLRKRDFLLRTSILGINDLSSSAGGENMPPIPSAASKSAPSSPVTSSRTSFFASDDFAPKPLMPLVSPPSIFASPDFKRRSASLGRDSVLAAIGESQLPSTSPNDIPMEFGRADVKSQDTRKSKTRRMNIKQIVMRITAAPTSAGEKLKLTTIHDSPSTPMVDLPHSFMPLDPPPSRRFGRPTNSSVPCLPSTKGLSEFGRSQGDVRSRNMFKSIKKRWNAVFSTARG